MGVRLRPLANYQENNPEAAFAAAVSTSYAGFAVI